MLRVCALFGSQANVLPSEFYTIQSVMNSFMTVKLKDDLCY